MSEKNTRKVPLSLKRRPARLYEHLRVSSERNLQVAIFPSSIPMRPCARLNLIFLNPSIFSHPPKHVNSHWVRVWLYLSPNNQHSQLQNQQPPPKITATKVTPHSTSTQFQNSRSCHQTGNTSIYQSKAITNFN